MCEPKNGGFSIDLQAKNFGKRTLAPPSPKTIFSRLQRMLFPTEATTRAAQHPYRSFPYKNMPRVGAACFDHRITMCERAFYLVWLPWMLMVSGVELVLLSSLLSGTCFS